MKIFKNIPLIRVFKDINNYRKWIKIIKNEKIKNNSLLNKYNIGVNYFYNLWVGVTLPDEDKYLPDNIKQLRVIESLAPVHRYLDNDLGFAGNIVPEFNRVFNDNGDPTLTYVIVYRFTFEKLSLKFVIIRLLILLGIIIAYFNVHWNNL